MNGLFLRKIDRSTFDPLMVIGEQNPWCYNQYYRNRLLSLGAPVVSTLTLSI